MRPGRDFGAYFEWSVEQTDEGCDIVASGH